MSASLHITISPSDADRQAVSKVLRKYRPTSFRRQLFTALGYWLALFVLFFFFFRQLGEVNDFIAHICDYSPSSYPADSEYEFIQYLLESCLAYSDDARLNLRYALLCLTGAFVLVYVLILFLFRRTWRANFSPLTGRRFTYSVTPQGFISAEAGISRAHHEWRGIRRIVRDKGWLLFFIEPCVAYFIPVSAFASEAHAQAFLDLAHDYHQQTQGNPL